MRKAQAGLYLVSTPIGNLGDMTLRGLQVLAGTDLIACEDTRVTHRLLDHYGIRTPLTPYHEHNAAAARPKLLARLAAGQPPCPEIKQPRARAWPALIAAQPPAVGPHLPWGHG